MKKAIDFRSIAIECLRGKWFQAVVVSFLASLLGGTLISFTAGFSNSIKFESDSFTSLEGVSNGNVEMAQVFISSLIILFLVAIVIAIFHMIIGGFVSLGNAKFQLSLVDQKDVNIGDLFSQASRFKAGFAMKFWVGIKVLLWSLLLFIPGIIKGYSYSMTPYIMYEHPELSASDAIKKSQEMMDGNKWRLFCLHFSFIGWHLLISLIPILFATILIGGLFGFLSALLAFASLVVLPVCGYILNAYQEAAQAAFYRDICDTHKETKDMFTIEEEALL